MHYYMHFNYLIYFLYCIINVCNVHVVNAAFLFFETSKLWALLMYIL